MQKLNQTENYLIVLTVFNGKKLRECKRPAQEMRSRELNRTRNMCETGNQTNYLGRNPQNKVKNMFIKWNYVQVNDIKCETQNENNKIQKRWEKLIVKMKTCYHLIFTMNMNLSVFLHRFILNFVHIVRQFWTSRVQNDDTDDSAFVSVSVVFVFALVFNEIQAKISTMPTARKE